jgi:signal transduction histidine kinase/CheY-like chemotaxis protein
MLPDRTITSVAGVIDWPRQSARIVGALLPIMGLTVLAGWALDVNWLKSVQPGWTKMSPLTALTFVLTGLAVFNVTPQRGLASPSSSYGNRISRRIRLGQSCAGIVAFIGLIRLFTFLPGWDLGLDQLWFHEPLTTTTISTRMAPATALGLLLMSCAVLFAVRSRFFAAFQTLALVGGLLGWLGFSHYLYGGDPLVPYADVAAHTAIGLLLLSAGVLCLRTDGGLMALLVSDSAGGVIARRLVPAVLIAPVVLGWLRLSGQRAGWFGTEAGVSLFALSNIVVFGGLVWAIASLLHRTDTGRKQAETKLQSQLVRLDLLQQITRSMGERLDLNSIFQVVLLRLEDQLPIDFGCFCLYDTVAEDLTVAKVGTGSEQLGLKLGISEKAFMAIDQNGLSRAVRGELIYEPDVSKAAVPFSQRLARVGLCSLVIAPLVVEGKVFGVLMAARREPNSFSSGDCEFMRQLSEHVALAAHQSQLHSTLQLAYEDLKHTREAAMQQERLRALGQMASGIAHDINNVLSPMALYTEALLESEPNLSATSHDKLKTIEKGIDDISETIGRLREFYRPSEQHQGQVPVYLNALVEQVVNLTRARWSDMAQRDGVMIEMVTDLASNLPTFKGSESELREALTNLIFNAVDAMPERGTLTVRTGLTEPRREFGGNAPQSVFLEVTDTGAGMDENTRRRCLEPFFTTKGERGTGLGLAMVYGIVQRHSAELEIRSEQGKGSAVRLSFSVPTVSSAGLAQTETEVSVPRNLRILVVDDDPLLLKTLCDILEADGHVVVGANSGQAGIDAFRAQDANEPFSIVLTDLGMPYVDGRQVASAVKDTSPATPVILLTGWGQRLLADHDVPPHVDCVLSKPTKLCGLREALARCLS